MPLEYLIIRQITTQDELANLRAAAALDPKGHYPAFPTHIATRGKEIVGCLSVCAVPVSGIWSHSQKMNARATAELVNIARNLCRQASPGRQIVTMCAETSPIYPHMEALGFKKIGPTVLFTE